MWQIWVTSDVPAQLEVSVDIRLVSFTENRVVKHVSRTVSLNHNHSAAAFSENIELFLGEYKVLLVCYFGADLISLFRKTSAS